MIAEFKDAVIDAKRRAVEVYVMKMV